MAVAITFEWDGQEYDLLRDTDGWTGRELRMVERWLRLSIEDMTTIDGLHASVAVTLRRSIPALNLDDVMDKTTGAFFTKILVQVQEEAEKEASTPPAADAEPVVEASAE